MSQVVSFTIPGIPQQQGSKRYVGRGISIEANKNLQPWREVALSRAWQAKREAGGNTIYQSVKVIATFWFPRPKRHYGTGRNAGRLLDGVPIWHAAAPDLDKLQRALGDMLTQSQLIHDDRLIAIWQASKRYGDEPRVDVTVQELT
jgi:Holliday junction resolvase RusA-like endonuclease